ncbi:MAG: C40 family peptidase [Nitrospirae bacterium]|nr:C40 family peptidase [Nitrospirota bacterium]
MKILYSLFIFVFSLIISTQAWADKAYVIKKGDSLYSISKKFKIEIDSIKKANEIVSDKLAPGTKLIIPSAESNIKKSIHEDTVLKKKKNPSVDSSSYKDSTEVKSTEDNSEYKEFQTTTLRERLALFAQKMLGIPYKFGSNTFMGIDCSAFVQKAFSLVGIPLPRTAREQFDIGEPVDKENLSVGDLVFFKTYASFPSHVGIYLGNNLFIHASRMTRKVTIDSLDAPYYLRRFIGAKRIELDEIEEKSL